MAIIYKGFSFKQWQRNKSFILTDVDLVKQDLINHIFTRKGERIGMRGFGTSIPDLIFEPFDQETIITINEQVRGVIAFDPRVLLRSEDDYDMVTDFDNKILAIQATLFFIELDLEDTLHINLTFES